MSKSVIVVELGERSYPIITQPGILTADRPNLAGDAAARDAWDHLHNELQQRKAVIVADTQVAPHYLPSAQRLCQQLGLSATHLLIPAGESAKSITNLTQIWNHLVELGHTRSSVLVALGGGVIGDLVGFAAATFMRGIDWVQVPTTLMAQVDSSVGGKTGVNLDRGKNLVGSFWQPRGVVIDPTVLATLDQRQFRSGLAEVVKYAVIMDPEFFSWLELQQRSILEQEPAVLAELIGHCCRLKAQVVGADERERTGRRAILNYGHTFGHALETVMGYGHWLHGEAVARGMTLAMATAKRLQMVDPLTVDRQFRLLTDFGLPAAELNEPQDPRARREWATQMIQAMGRDKKNQGRGVELILPTKIGRVESVLWPGDELIRSVLEDIP